MSRIQCYEWFKRCFQGINEMQKQSHTQLPVVTETEFLGAYE